MLSLIVNIAALLLFNNIICAVFDCRYCCTYSFVHQENLCCFCCRLHKVTKSIDFIKHSKFYRRHSLFYGDLIYNLNESLEILLFLISSKSLSSIIKEWDIAWILQPKRVKFTNCSQFLSHNFLGLDFHFYVIFLHIGIGQLDNDV